MNYQQPATSNQSVKVNAFKKGAYFEQNKKIYEDCAGNIGCRIEYGNSSLGHDWVDVFLVGSFSDEKNDEFHSLVIRATTLLSRVMG